MKLEPGQTIVVKNKKYKGEIPDAVAEKIGLKKPAEVKESSKK